MYEPSSVTIWEPSVVTMCEPSVVTMTAYLPGNYKS